MVVGSPQYSLKWNDYNSYFARYLQKMQRRDEFTDVTLSCEGKHIKGHKVILAAYSPYLHDVFKEHGQTNTIVVFKNVRFEDLASIIQFMYRGETCVSQERLLNFFQTADLLKVRGLTKPEHVRNLESKLEETGLKCGNCVQDTNKVRPSLSKTPVEFHEIIKTEKKKIMDQKTSQKEVKLKRKVLNYSKQDQTDEENMEITQAIIKNKLGESSTPKMEPTTPGSQSSIKRRRVSFCDNVQNSSKTLSQPKNQTNKPTLINKSDEKPKKGAQTKVSGQMDDFEILKSTKIFRDTLERSQKVEEILQNLPHSTLEQLWKEQGTYECTTEFTDYLHIAFSENKIKI